MTDQEGSKQEPIKQQLPDAEIVLDENAAVKGSDRLPIKEPLKVFRYRTIKKNNSLGWWSAVVLLQDHEKKQVCFYRWRKNKTEWKRDKKIAFRTKEDWVAIKDAVEAYINELD
jgi:hypothetical protein